MNPRAGIPSREGIFHAAFIKRVHGPIERLGSRRLHPQAVCPDFLTARRKGNVPGLTRREIFILDMLHRHAGFPVARDTLLEECRDPVYFPDWRTLDQHILVLRKEIEADPAKPAIIETVRGIGYRFRSL